MSRHTHPALLAFRLAGQDRKQAYADILKWQAVAAAMGEPLISAEERAKQDAPQLKHPAPQNRFQRRAEAKRLKRGKRR